MPLDPALHAYLQAMAANLISAGVRLVPLGQTDGQRILAALEPVVAATAERGAGHHARRRRVPPHFGPISRACDHETQYTRLFRS